MLPLNIYFSLQIFYIKLNCTFSNKTYYKLVPNKRQEKYKKHESHKQKSMQSNELHSFTYYFLIGFI